MMSKKELLAELDEHNDFFDMIVDLFPSQLYVSGGVGNTSNNNKKKNPNATTTGKPGKNKMQNKYHKKAVEPASQKMEKSKQTRNNKNQDKRRKAGSSGEENTNTEKKSKQKQEQAESSSTGDLSKKPQPEHHKTAPSDSPPRARIDVLRAKLQARISEKQSGRPVVAEGTEEADQISKRAARRADKKRRQEEAQKRANHKKSKSSESDDHNKTYQVASENTTPAQDLAKVDFGRLTGLKNPQQEADNRAKDVLQNLTKGKNLHKILHDAEAKREKLQELKAKGEKEKLAALQWKDTFQEANGTRIKDDPAKLKRALKKKVAKRQKSQKAWQARTEQTKVASKERLKIRNHNLNARKQGGKAAANLSRKEIRKPDDDGEGKTSRKGGKNGTRAGFDGRKKEFLEKKGKGQKQGKQ